MTALAAQSRLLPSAAVAVSAVLWGLYWLPMRYLEAGGIAKAWPSLVLNIVVFAILMPGLVRRRGSVARHFGSLLFSGLAAGGALALYGISLNLTDVVRSVLLFYMMPIWGTVIGLIWLGERLTSQRVAALVLGVAGMLIVLRADEGLPLPRNVGDWMALVSGIAWAVGSARIFLAKEIGTYETASFFALGAAVITGAGILFLPVDVMGPAPTAAAIEASIPIIAASVLLLMIPILFLTVWGTQRLPPATVGLLLLAEIVVAVGSAAILIEDEPFGVREILGTVLIAGAGVVEILPARSAKRNTP
ncbi:MAG: DMT family transporter [Alphaproteobacteria bacterium]